MKLIRIAKKEYQTLLACDPAGDCPVLDYLTAGGGGNREQVAQKMLRLLKETVPDQGPNLRGREIVRHLKGPISEYKRRPKSGAQLRVLFFRDRDRFICTHAFQRDDHYQSPLIDAAQETYRIYHEAKAARDITIEVWEAP